MLKLDKKKDDSSTLIALMNTQLREKYLLKLSKNNIVKVRKLFLNSLSIKRPKQ
jgi:hypothetical protein